MEPTETNYKTTLVPYACSLLTPIFASIVYIVDKHTISKKVHHIDAYIATAGCVNIVEG
jgi:hypothetical protein